MGLTKKQWVKCYDIVFDESHTDVFKVEEIKEVMFQNNYYFLDTPRENWRDKLKKYLTKLGYTDFSKTNLR